MSKGVNDGNPILSYHPTHDDVICWIDIYDHDTCCFAVFFNDAASTNRQKTYEQEANLTHRNLSKRSPINSK